MKFKLTPADQAFREEVRAFVADHLDPTLARQVRLGYPIDKSDQDAWTRTLNGKGWAAPNWPTEVGGPGWSMVRRHIFGVEMKTAHAPELQGFGFSMVGPAIITYGTQAQKDYYLPRILNADISWCQGYSEPGAGSDLASLTTRADNDGDEYVINGSKIWTSAAEVADHIFMLVRTDQEAKPQRGITFLLVPMDRSGVTVEPLVAFNGKRLWNQVFFENVRVPKENRLGEENRGWTVAKNLLGNERLLVSRVAENRRLLGKIMEITHEETARGVTFSEDLYKQMAELELRLSALDSTALRLLSRFDLGGTIGAEPSMLKLKGSQMVQDMDRLMVDAIGYYSQPLDSTLREGGPAGPEYADMVASAMFHHRGYTIAGGATEIQYNIIAKQVLGL